MMFDRLRFDCLIEHIQQTYFLHVNISGCAQPPALDNGILVVSNDGYQANYTCNLGYSLKGLQIRQCLLATSKWEDMDPECGIIFMLGYHFEVQLKT